MTSLPNIQQLINQNRLQEAIAELSKLIALSENADASVELSGADREERLEATAPLDELYYRRGRLFWQSGNHGAAVSDYERAVENNPQSPAATALELARDVFNYFNPDLLNP